MNTLSKFLIGAGCIFGAVSLTSLLSVELAIGFLACLFAIVGIVMVLRAVAESL